jgi:hypothetical protein
MAQGQSATVGNAYLDATLAAYPWVKMHTAAPGANGTANAATETTRKQATWNAASAGGATNSGALTWSSVAATETWTHFSAWSASSAGTFGFSGTVSGNNALTAGDNANIAAGGLSVTTPLAS